MRRKRRALSNEEPIVNLTPLIDVVFVILFTFIVVAPLLEVDKVELAGGGSTGKHSTPEKHSPVAIHVFRDDSIAYNQQKVSLNELSKRLRVAKRQHKNVRPQLFHDKKASFGTYQSVKNAVEAAGFSELDVILKP